MADNPTRRLADQARASYQKVAAAQQQLAGGRENALQRQQQGMQQAGQSLQRLGEQQQQKEQFESAQKQEQEQFEAGKKQQQEQFETERKDRKYKFLMEQELAYDEMDARAKLEAQKIKIAKQQAATSKLREERLSQQYSAESQVAREEHFNKRHDWYREQLNKLDARRDGLFVGDQKALSEVERLMAKSEEFKDNKMVQQAMQGAKAGDPAAVEAVIQHLDTMYVKTMIDQAGEIGEWNPSPRLITHPEVQQFNAMLVKSKLETTQQLGDTLAAMSPEKRKKYVDLLGSATERNRRLVKKAYQHMRHWYEAQVLRAGVPAYNQMYPNQQVQVENVTQNQ